MEKYEPCNGTEMDSFYEEFCRFCVFDINEDCNILLRAVAYNTEDTEYPVEWIRDENGPRCTAFVATNNNRHIPDMELI